MAGRLRLLRRRAAGDLAISRPLTAAVLVEGAVYAFFFVLGFATVGLVLALRRPGNPIGWLYLAAGLAWAYTIPVQPRIDQLVRERRPLPLVPQLVAATGDLSWAPAVALGVTLPALLLPNGRLRSRRWRLVVVTSVTGLVLVMVAGPLSPGPLEETGVDNPFGLAGPAGDVAATLTIVGVVLHWLSLPPAAVCVALRFRSSRGSSASSCAGSRPRWPGSWWASRAGAVLRYRLWDLDRVVSRTLSWALLTVLLGLGYAAAVLGLAGWPARAPAWPWPRPPLAVVDQTMQPTQASLWLRHTP